MDLCNRIICCRIFKKIRSRRRTQVAHFWVIVLRHIKWIVFSKSDFGISTGRTWNMEWRESERVVVWVDGRKDEFLATTLKYVLCVRRMAELGMHRRCTNDWSRVSIRKDAEHHFILLRTHAPTHTLALASSVVVLAGTGSKAHYTHRIPFETFTDKYLRYVTHNINEHIPWYVFFVPARHAERRRTTCMHSFWAYQCLETDKPKMNSVPYTQMNEHRQHFNITACTQLRTNALDETMMIK